MSLGGRLATGYATSEHFTEVKTKVKSEPKEREKYSIARTQTWRRGSQLRLRAGQSCEEVSGWGVVSEVTGNVWGLPSLG